MRKALFIPEPWFIPGARSPENHQICLKTKRLPSPKRVGVCVHLGVQVLLREVIVGLLIHSLLCLDSVCIDLLFRTQP